MSEITKLYENAGVGYLMYVVDTFPSVAYPQIDFTAEKQLDLIKWLAKTRPIHITFLIDKWVIEGMVRYGKRYDTFEDALSGYINNIWQTLTEQERTQIRSILNG